MPEPENAIRIYRDHDRNGDSYTVYCGTHSIGTFLSDDPILHEYIKKIGGEKNIRHGLHND